MEVHLRSVIEPAVVVRRVRLDAAVHQTRERLTVGEVRRRAFKAVRPGWEWGPKWSTAWFRLRGTVPAEMRRLAGGQRGRVLALRFSTDTEALAFDGERPMAGLDVNRDLVMLPPSMFRAGARKDAGKRAGSLEMFIEAACNHPFGARGLLWDVPDVQRRWESPKPGRFLYAEVVEVDTVVRELAQTMAFAIGLVRELMPASPPMFTATAPWMTGPAWQSSRAEELAQAVERAIRLVDPADVSGTAAAGLAVLRGAIGSGCAPSALNAHAVGHAHIDTAWLWPLGVTRRKCLRTFSSVLRLMESDPSFVFLCSQAQQYAYVEEDSPELFTEIARRVQEGRWEAGGAMWIEPDCNVPSGESLVRQILHGCGYWREKFGSAGAQRFVYLPDTFGFPACLPQIMRLSGLDTFITNKLSWHDTNPYVDTTFVWRGLDGSEVLAHQTPSHDYNAANTPRDLRRAENNHRSKQLLASGEHAGDDRGVTGEARGARFLTPFGFGDGGGGPTEAMLVNTRLSAACDGLPRVEMTRVSDFCERLHEDVQAAQDRGVNVPVHTGELPLELHRGTLTSQAWLKRAMRRAEEDLRLAEMLVSDALVRGTMRANSKEFAAARADLDRAWKTTLLNQFHDILPGSSIREVYDDARTDMARVQETISPHIERLLAHAAEGVERGRVMMFNPASCERDELAAFGDGLVRARLSGLCFGAGDGREDLSGLGAARIEPAADGAVRVSNGVLSAIIDRAGRVLSLALTHGDGRIVADLADGPLNQMVLHEDRPVLWDAWDVDAYAVREGEVDARIGRLTVLERGPARVRVRVSRPLGRASTITQEFELIAGSRRLDVRTSVDWREEHRMLRVMFPVRAHASHAAFQTQFGRIERPTHTNTHKERAAFEVPVQRWMDLSQPDRGLTVLNQSQFGCCVDENVLGLTLLRSSRYPDATADIGVHEFTYAMMPHGPRERGLWTPDAETQRLCRPVIVRGGTGTVGRGAKGRPARTGGAEGVSVSSEHDGGEIEVSAIKPRESGGAGVVVRVVETGGRSQRVRVRVPGARGLRLVDLLERPIGAVLGQDAERRVAGPEMVLELRPFEVASVLAEIGARTGRYA